MKFLNDIRTSIKNLKLLLDVVSTEIKANYKMHETTDGVFYEIQFPGYSLKDVSLKVYSQNVLGQYSMVIKLNNQRYGEKVFTVSLEPNLDIKNISYSMENGILYLVFEKVKTGLLLVDLELGKT